VVWHCRSAARVETGNHWRIVPEVRGKGRKIGGKRSLETMTAEERSARATKASLAATAKAPGCRAQAGKEAP
jgi:hypothetical protein